MNCSRKQISFSFLGDKAPGYKINKIQERNFPKKIELLSEN